MRRLLDDDAVAAGLAAEALREGPLRGRRWQDIRFGGVDQIAFWMSTDGGDIWSVPIKVSQTPPSADPADEQAWVPAVQVSDDGTAP